MTLILRLLKTEIEPKLTGKWTYDEKQDTWRFWRDEDGQNVIKISRSQRFGLIPARLHGSGITDPQAKKIALPIQKKLFALSDSGIYSYKS